MPRFVDCNVEAHGPLQSQIVAQAVNMGYDGIVWNVYATPKTLAKCQIRKIPLADFASLMAGPQSAQFCLRSRGSELFIQRTRITLIIENMKDAQNLNRQFLQTYDLLAVQPMGDEKVFQYCCQSIQPDIIALDLSKKIPFHLKFSTVGSAISNGCFFEISIRGTTDNPTARKNFFRNSLSLIRACKKKNIILTSGAATPFDMRSPHDIQNVALLLGISAPEALAAMSIHALSVLLHAESRSIHKTVIQARSIESLSEHDSWKKPSSSIN